MKCQRPHTQIIADRAAIFASFRNCNALEQQAARTAASARYNEGTSGANAVCYGYRVAVRRKQQGVDRGQRVVIPFFQRTGQLRLSNT